MFELKYIHPWLCTSAGWGQSWMAMWSRSFLWLTSLSRQLLWPWVRCPKSIPAGWETSLESKGFTCGWMGTNVRKKMYSKKSRTELYDLNNLWQHLLICMYLITPLWFNCAYLYVFKSVRKLKKHSNNQE